MEKRIKFQLKETIATIICEEEFIEIAENEIKKRRRELESYIRRDPFFQLTFDPYNCPSTAPEIVKRMANASAKAGVGPMAAVAGAISEFAVKAMIESGAQHAIVDNGGDIAMYLSHPIIVGIYTGDSPIKNLGLRVKPQDCIIGICTSSGKIGHSISFGNANAVTVISKNVALADAAATALGNVITEGDKYLIETAINDFKIDDIEGIMVVIDNHVGVSGKLPEILKARVDYDLITKG